MGIGREEFVVFSFPLGLPSPPPSLTEAERSIGLELVAGHSNAVIAASRGTSVRTVANQVSTLIRKLGVRSRREASVAFFRAPPRADP
jgi:DNA-binding NarL/FixJ family response regulator